METENVNTMSKRKQELRKHGFNWEKVSREECERDLPDPYRFRFPERYMTEEELKYFKSDEQRELFKEMFWNK